MPATEGQGGRIVIDASALAGLVLPDEADGPLADALRSADPVAPALLWAEIRNLLLMAERRGRIETGTLEQVLRAIDGLGIEVDTAPASDHVIALARRHRLTVYDALYLELAMRLGARLATADKALAQAAEREAVAVL